VFWPTCDTEVASCRGVTLNTWVPFYQVLLPSCGEHQTGEFIVPTRARGIHNFRGYPWNVTPKQQGKWCSWELCSLVPSVNKDTVLKEKHTCNKIIACKWNGVTWEGRSFTSTGGNATEEGVPSPSTGNSMCKHRRAQENMTRISWLTMTQKLTKVMVKQGQWV